MNQETPEANKEERTNYLPVILVSALLALAGMFFAFKLGEYVGYQKTAYSYSFDRGRGMMRQPRLMPFGNGQRGPMLMNPHASLGVVKGIESGVIKLENPDGTEKDILLDDQTQIRRGWENLKISDIKVGQKILVIGSPSDQGQVRAKLVDLQ